MSVMVPVGILDATDHVLPQGSFSYPTSGATISGSVTLAVNVTDNDQIKQVQFRVDGSNIGSPVTGPFQVGWDSRTIGNGSHTFTAIVTDRVGNQITLTVTATVNNMPTVAITNPGSGATVGGTITLQANATSYGGAPTVQWNIDGSNVGGALGSPYNLSYNTHNLAVGWHTLYATVRDPQGNSVQTSLSFYVSNGIAGTSIYLGNWAIWNGEYYDDYRNSGPDYGNRWAVNAIWNNLGTLVSQYFGLPGNPDPANYQMRIQMGTTNAGRVEGGSDGNQVYIYMDINGNEYNVWQNGPTWGPFRSGPAINVSGGESVRMCRWDSSPGWNTCFIVGVCIYIDYIPRYVS